MGMNVNLHTRTAEKFIVRTKLDSAVYTGTYPVITVTVKPEGTWDTNEITFFPSFEQAKQLHKELSELMKEIAALDKRTKAEIHAKSILNSKAQKFSQLVEKGEL